MNTDPIADFLTRIRNAIQARHDYTSVPHSKMKVEIAKILQNEKFIEKFEIVSVKVKNKEHKNIKVTLNPNKQIKSIKRISKPGQRIYIGSNNISKIRNGYGLSIISTSKGVITNKEAWKNKIGGEVLCEVY